MTDELKREWYRVCRGWAARLIKYTNHNVPDCMMAQAVIALYHSAEGYIGPAVADEITRTIIERGRARIGRCIDCDERVTHGNEPYCDACAARITTEMNQLEADARNYFPEEWED